MPELPELYTIPQIVERLGCSERTLRGIITATGCFRKIGKTVFLTAEDLDALFEALKPKPFVSHVPPPRRPGRMKTKITAPVVSARRPEKKQPVRPEVTPMPYIKMPDKT
jgi:hypothetical protein